MGTRQKILFLTFLTAANLLATAEVNAKRIVLDIPDQDIAVVENDVVDAEKWIKEAWAGKVSKCKERIIQAEVTRSLQAKETLPSGDTAIINKAMKRSDYKNRKQRDAEFSSQMKEPK